MSFITLLHFSQNGPHGTNLLFRQQGHGFFDDETLEQLPDLQVLDHFF